MVCHVYYNMPYFHGTIPNSQLVLTIFEVCKNYLRTTVGKKRWKERRPSTFGRFDVHDPPA